MTENSYTKEMICISCPLGCRMTVTVNTAALGEPEISVSGNKCARGVVYGREEILAPKRVVTATVRLLNGNAKRLPVKTSAPLPRELSGKLLNELYRLEVKAPVKLGDIIFTDVFGTGINVVATRSSG